MFQQNRHPLNPYSRRNNVHPTAPYMYHYENYYPKQTCIELEKKELYQQIDIDPTPDDKTQQNRSEKTGIFSLFNNLNLPFNLNLDSLTSNSITPVFEVMGIKLYIDDIILLCLLFILYNEETKDELLFISLILLLLS